jgi:hypothetical protein
MMWLKETKLGGMGRRGRVGRKEVEWKKEVERRKGSA